MAKYASSHFNQYVQERDLKESVGQHPLVTSLMAGIFNSRSPQPRYVFVWDVQVVLNFC